MRVAVFGLGYVGSVMTGCLARAGHSVIGVDVQADRVALVAGGGSPVIEPGVPEAIARGAAEGLITATGDAASAVQAADISFICVSTPSAPDEGLDTSRVEAVCRQIGELLADGAPPAAPHTIVIRSTVMPGTVARCHAIVEEVAGPAGQRWTLALNPEFLREGAGVADFEDPPYTLVGAADPAWADPLRELYAFVGAPFVVADPGVAEVLKTVCNAWHATKVSFANEVGRLCGAVGTDAHEVMRLFAKDERLNLSASYLTPGFAYGGSCLPKDIGALGHLARHHHVELPILQGVPRSNALHIESAVRAIVDSGRHRIGFLGLSFKPGTDDLRESPLLDLVQACLGKGLRVRILDTNVKVGSLVGSNRDYALSRIRSLAELLVDTAEELIEAADLVVLGHGGADFRAICRSLPEDKVVLDLVRAVDPDELSARYVGLFW